VSAAGPKRFYENAAATEADDGHGIALDGKPVRTPAGRPLALPGAALADALAEEWAAQGETIEHATMPLTRLACTALDLVPERRAETVAEVSSYAETDLICYRTDEPPALARRQADAWQPLVAWADERYGALVPERRAETVAEVSSYAETDLICYRTDEPPALARRQADAWQPLVAWADERYGARLAVTTSITPIAQPPAALAAFRDAVEAEEDFALAGLSLVTRSFGSLVIALGLRDGRLDAAAAADASLVDERYQMERWGEDEELAARCRRVAQDAASAARLFRLLAA